MKPSRILRLVFILIMLGVFHLTQAMIAMHPNPIGVYDFGLIITRGWRDWLEQNPFILRWGLIVSSLGIDALFCFVVVRGSFGPSSRPLIGLCFIFVLRQVSEGT